MIISLIILFLQITLGDVAQILGVISSLIIAIGVIAGVVWFVFKGKSLESCKEDLTRAEKKIAELKEEAETADKKRLQAEIDKSKVETRMKEIETQLSEAEDRLRRTQDRFNRSEEDWEKKRLRMIAEIQSKGGNWQQFQ